MSDESVAELYERFNLSPTPGPKPVSGQEEQYLSAAVSELEAMLQKIEELKRSSRTAEDWRALCIYIASIKPRLSELSSQAKRIYAKSFGEAYDRHYAQGKSGEGRGVSVKVIENRAKSDAALAYQVSERLERTWRDLQDLLWACKAVADDLAAGERTDSFEAMPEHLFSPAA